MPKQSAGLLLYRRRAGALEVFLGAPGRSLLGRQGPGSLGSSQRRILTRRRPAGRRATGVPRGDRLSTPAIKDRRGPRLSTPAIKDRRGPRLSNRAIRDRRGPRLRKPAIGGLGRLV